MIDCVPWTLLARDDDQLRLMDQHSANGVQ